MLNVKRNCEGKESYKGREKESSTYEGKERNKDLQKA